MNRLPQLTRAFGLSAGDLQFTIDWNKGRWSNMPIGVQLGVVSPILGQPIRFFLNPQYNFRALRGADQFKLLVGIALVATEH